MFQITCAAFDTPEKLKKSADYVCDENDARPVMQEAIDEADELGVSCVLLRGTYVINSRGEKSSRGAICFYNPEEGKRFYSQNRARYHVLEGAMTPLGYLDGAVVTMGKDFYDSLSDQDSFSLFYADGNNIFGRGMIIRNIVVRLPGSNKPIIVFDGRYASAVRYEDDWVSSFDPAIANLATAEGIPLPHPHSVAFRGCCGSNFYATEWKNCVAQGFGTGFDIGGEHVYCESLSALYNIWGFAFDCYKGKENIDLPDDLPAKGICVYPVYCVNLLDEHNINMPKFGNESHNGRTTDSRAQSVTIRGMNLQWPNSAPGYTDRTAPDFLKGRHRATEVQKGSWRGSIEYVIDHTSPTSGVNLTEEPFFEEGNGLHIQTVNLQKKQPDPAKEAL